MVTHADGQNIQPEMLSPEGSSMTRGHRAVTIADLDSAAHPNASQSSPNKAELQHLLAVVGREVNVQLVHTDHCWDEGEQTDVYVSRKSEAFTLAAVVAEVDAPRHLALLFTSGIIFPFLKSTPGGSADMNDQIEFITVENEPIYARPCSLKNGRQENGDSHGFSNQA